MLAWMDMLYQYARRTPAQKRVLKGGAQKELFDPFIEWNPNNWFSIWVSSRFSHYPMLYYRAIDYSDAKKFIRFLKMKYDTSKEGIRPFVETPDGREVTLIEAMSLARARLNYCGFRYEEKKFWEGVVRSSGDTDELLNWAREFVDFDFDVYPILLNRKMS